MDKRVQAFQEPGKHDHCLFIKAHSCKPDGPIPRVKGNISVLIVLAEFKTD